MSTGARARQASSPHIVAVFHERRFSITNDQSNIIYPNVRLPTVNGSFRKTPGRYKTRSHMLLAPPSYKIHKHDTRSGYPLPGTPNSGVPLMTATNTIAGHAKRFQRSVSGARRETRRVCLCYDLMTRSGCASITLHDNKIFIFFVHFYYFSL